MQWTISEIRVARAKSADKKARNEVERSMRRTEREWRMKRMNECKETCVRGRRDDMYKWLRKTGTNMVKAAERSVISISNLKSHFEGVS